MSPLPASDMTLTNLVGHINNLYNTTFWALIQLGGMDGKEAEKELAVSAGDSKWNHLLGI